MAPDQLELDGDRLAGIGRRLGQDALPADQQWPVSWAERASLEAEAETIKSLRTWYSKTRDLLFSMAGGQTDTVFVMRMDSSAPDSATEARLSEVEERLGVEKPPERERVGTRELWSICGNRAGDLVSRIEMFANLLVQHRYLTKEQLATVELRPPDAVRRNAIRGAELAEMETCGAIRVGILAEVKKFAADQSFGDPSISQEIVERTASAQAERDALRWFNDLLGRESGGVTVDFLTRWVRVLASKKLLPARLQIPGLSDWWTSRRA